MQTQSRIQTDAKPELGSVTELAALRRRLTTDNGDEHKPTIVVCSGTACQASEAFRIVRRVKRHLLNNNLLDRVNLRVTGCHGFCEMGPFILTEPQRAFYTRLNHYHVPRIINAFLTDSYVDELLYQDPATEKRYYDYDEIPFFGKQLRTLLRANQDIDPIRMFDYIARGGYAGLEKVLAKPQPAWILDEVERSKLRGRGGAGFPTARKWRLAHAQPGDVKYVVCNADEGDPGAYMDRSLLEGNPHSVIEGMIIGAVAMGATEGFVFVRHEYPQAIKHTLIALRMARAFGLLGNNILGTGIDFDIHIVKSAGAFVCGEETALIRTIEGFVGEPKQRPPFPVEKGLFGKPTCINNVESWANIPLIIKHGGETYARTGTDNSTGTKVFSLVGKIRNTGLVEVPMGTTIGEIVHDIGGGPQPGGTIKAVQIGGPSGGCIPHWRFDLPIDYDSLREAGAIMGSGGLIVMDQDTCMVDVAKYFMSFLQDESCGKCLTCRKGTQRLYELLDDVSCGRATLQTLDLLEELAEAVQNTTMCGLGQSAPNPVLSTLRYFRDEYERHIVDKRCDAFVCKELVAAPCQSGCPLGTEVWRYVAHIARGEYEQAYQAIRECNPFPSVCARVCDHPCETRCRLGTTGKEPIAVRALKRFVTDTVEPSKYSPPRESADRSQNVAVVGAGPAGLTAAHLLAMQGYRVTLLDANDKPGGMLALGIPEYRLPREVLDREVNALLDDRISLRMNTTLGRDVTVDQLFDEGFAAVFLAIGSLESQPLGIDGEAAAGVHASISFLEAFNLRGAALARGRVGVIGGGNSAIDAARVALRQPDVESVTIFYRRSREQMPAFREEIDAALEEGVVLETLVSPVRVIDEDGKLTALECLRNELGERDSSGRRRPLPVAGSEHQVALDTLIVAIGEKPDRKAFSDGATNVTATRWGTVQADRDTLATTRPGLFAGGDVVTGSNTVVEAIAAGKRVATMIDRYLRSAPLRQPDHGARPSCHVEPPPGEGALAGELRLRTPHTPRADRVGSFVEVERTIDETTACREAQRCLRCDLDFVGTDGGTSQQPCAGKGSHE